MQASNPKRLFLNNFLLGLHEGGLSSQNMSFPERKNVIRLSSDVALATLSSKANWSRALIANISRQEKNKILVGRILGKEFYHLTEPNHKSPLCKMVKSKKILRRSCAVRRMRKCSPKRSLARTIALKILSKKTQILKILIPGGKSIDDFSLLDETMDYIRALEAQVDVMQRLANTFEQINNKVI
ncbi:hypothetical protein ACLOJK_002742 [Asimina triloba]